MAKVNLDVPKGVYLLALTDEVAEPPKEIQILPYGLVNSQRGDFFVDEEAIGLILADYEKRVNDMVIDYEHQTLSDKEAPAGGWIKRIFSKGQEGLWAEVSWTPRAAEYLRNREYRYLSPVVGVRKQDKRAIYLHSAALTNVPAIDGMVPLVPNTSTNLKEDEDMDELLKKLRLALGLAEDAGEESVVEAIVALKQKTEAETVANTAVLSLLDLDEKATVDQVKGKILALKGPADMYSDVASKLRELEAKLVEKEADGLVELALKDGKIAPASKDWLKQYALKDPTGAKAFVDSAPQVVPLGKHISGGKEVTGKGADDEVQMAVCKSLGLTKEQLEKWNGGDE